MRSRAWMSLNVLVHIGLPEWLVCHRSRTALPGVPDFATDTELVHLATLHPNALICVGQIESPNARIRLFDLVRAAGFAMPAIVSPLASVSRHAVIGEGTIVMHGAVVNAGAVVGRNCIVNAGVDRA